MLDPIDRIPQGEPETIVELPDGTRLLGYYIRGLEGLHMLGVHEDAQGREIAFASEDGVLHVDTLTKRRTEDSEDMA